MRQDELSLETYKRARKLLQIANRAADTSTMNSRMVN